MKDIIIIIIFSLLTSIIITSISFPDKEKKIPLIDEKVMYRNERQQNVNY